jgi:hypothetical protein
LTNQPQFKSWLGHVSEKKCCFGRFTGGIVHAVLAWKSIWNTHLATRRFQPIMNSMYQSHILPN